MEQETAPGERKNKTPLFLTGVKNIRAFLKWLKEQTGGDGSARMQGDKLVIVPNTADCFRATVRVLRSIEASQGVSFHTYSLPEDRCTRLLIKGLGKTMPEQDVREELEILGIPAQSVLQLRSQRRDPDPAKDRFPTPHFIVTVARGPLVSKVRAITSLCGVTVDTYRAPKGPIQCKNCQRFGHTKRNCGYPPRCVACGGPHVSDGKCTVAQEEKRCANCNSNHTANYRGCSKWKESKATSSQRPGAAQPKNQGPKRTPKPKKQVQLSPEQQSLGPEWSHVSTGGRTVKPTPKEVQQSESIAQAAQVTKVTKPRTPSTKRSATPIKSSDSPLAMITALAKDIPLSSLAGVISHVMREEPNFPKGEDRPRAILTSILLYTVQNGC